MQHLSIQRIRRRLRQSPRLAGLLRYIGTLAGAAAVTQLLSISSLPPPIGGVLAIGSVLIFAWFGGLGPAIFLSPLLLLLSRLGRDDAQRWAAMTSQELMGFTVVLLITTLTGLAGEYRRRIRAVSEQHEKKLREQARALSQAPIVFRTIDGRITEWNQGLERLCGWSAAEAQDRQLHELLETSFPEKLASVQEELARTGQWCGEVAFRHKNGNDLHVLTHWILYHDTEKNPIGVAEVFTDVTELRRAEAAVRNADRRKDEFLAVLAHELRNPLAPIRTGLELLRLAKDDPNQVDATREIMERQMKQLVVLVDDLLDVSRITRGKLELRKSRVLLSDVISSAVESATPAIDAAGHELVTTLPSSAVYLNADPNRLAQVLSNLLDNAAKYTPPGGLITLTAEKIENEIVLSVIDNGPGIPPGMLDRIFEMFARCANTGEAMHSGLGIGLALVKSIIDLHGGHVEARNASAGSGTELIVRLPVIDEISAIVAGPDIFGDHSAQDRRRVLIVDDNVDAVRMLSMVVKMLGHEVCVAHDGLEAIAAAEQFRPEVVLLDLGMPKLDGYGAARHIRGQPWGQVQKMTLIALTGWGQDSDKQRTMDAGFDHHLVKPADPNELKRLLSNGHARNQSATAPACL